MEAKVFDFADLPLNHVLEGVSLVAIDLETGGLAQRLENGELGCDYYPIFEVAVKVLDADLNELAAPLCIPVYQSEEMIARSSEWALKKHTEIGLLKRVRLDGIDLNDVEQQILVYLSELGIPKYDKKARVGGIMTGNGIHFDRFFITAQMPRLNDYLFYRQMDISGMNIACLLWNEDLYREAREVKQYPHEALKDINESIDELKIYKPLFVGGEDDEV